MSESIKSLDGSVEYGTTHQNASVKMQCCVRQFLAFNNLLRRANDVVEKILEPVQSKEYGIDVFYYYHSVLHTSRWDKPKYLGSRDIEKLAPTYAIEQAALMVQATWRKRMTWRAMLAKIAAQWSKIQDPSTGAEYYYNYQTGETSWEKPALFGRYDIEDFEGINEKLLKKKAKEEKKEKAAEKKRKKEEALALRKAEKGKMKDGEEEVDEQDGNDDGEEDDDDDDEDDEDEEEDEDDDDEDDDDESEDEKMLPRNWPRSKVQIIVDKVEDQHYRRKEGTNHWSNLASAVFLGGFAKNIERLSKEELKEQEEEQKAKLQSATEEEKDPTALSLAINHLDLHMVSSRMWEMGDSLTDLNLSANSIEHISIDVSGLTRLKTLNLSQNKIKEVPDDWFNSRTCLTEELPLLRTLDLRSNLMKEIPISLYFNRELECLRLGGNKLTSFPCAKPGDTSAISQQDYLDLLRAKGTTVLGIGFIYSLIELDASDNLLTRVPETLDECAGLQILKLQNNQLTALPDTFDSNEELIHLDLSGNKLSSLVASRQEDDEEEDEGDGEEGESLIAGLVHLNEFYLQNNPLLTSLPSLESMRVLKILNLSHCNFSDTDRLAESLSGLGALTTLNLSHNKITKLPFYGVGGAKKPPKETAAEDKGGKRAKTPKKKKKKKKGGDIKLGFENLVYLDVCHNEIASLESQLPPALDYIDISHNQLQIIEDKNLLLCKRLKHLLASHNRIGKFPDGIGNLFKLEEIDFSHNNIQLMNGSAIRLLLGIKTLNLSHNQLEEVPTELCKPPLLERLNLSYNNLMSFPDCGPVPLPTPSKKSLTSGGSFNKSRSFSATNSVSGSGQFGGGDQISEPNWNSLKMLNLSHNDLDNIPENVIENATSLQELYLDHNFLEQLPSSSALIQLEELTKFTVRSNDIPHMPAALLELLPKLKFVDVSTNPFNGLPAHMLVDHTSAALALQESDNVAKVNSAGAVENKDGDDDEEEDDDESRSGFDESKSPQNISKVDDEYSKVGLVKAGDLAASRAVAAWKKAVAAADPISVGDNGSAASVRAGSVGPPATPGSPMGSVSVGSIGGSRLASRMAHMGSRGTTPGSPSGGLEGWGFAETRSLVQQQAFEKSTSIINSMASEVAKRVVIDHFGGEVLTMRLGAAHLMLARVLLQQQKELEEKALLRNLPVGSAAWELHHAQEDALKAQREANSLLHSLQVAEASAKAGGRLKDLKLVLKSISTWPFSNSYDLDPNRERQILVPPLVVRDEYDSDEDDEEVELISLNNSFKPPPPPSQLAIRIEILSCSGLAKADGLFGKSDPYVEVSYQGATVHRTTTMKKTLDPVWASEGLELSIEVPPPLPSSSPSSPLVRASSFLASTNPPSSNHEKGGEAEGGDLVIAVYDDDKGGKSQFLGQVEFRSQDIVNMLKPSKIEEGYEDGGGQDRTTSLSADPMILSLNPKVGLSSKELKYVKGKITLKISLVKEEVIPSQNIQNSNSSKEQDEEDEIRSNQKTKETLVSGEADIAVVFSPTTPNQAQSNELIQKSEEIETRDNEAKEEDEEEKEDEDEEEEKDDDDEGGTSGGRSSMPGLTTTEIKAVNALTATRKRELEEAVKALNQAEERVGAARGYLGSGVDIVFCRASAFMGLNEPGLALPDIEKTLSLAPTHLTSLVMRSELRETAGQYRQARGDCKKGLRLVRSFSDKVAGKKEAEKSLERTLEKVENGLTECRRNDIDSAEVEREFEITREGIAVRRRRELTTLIEEGRSMKRSYIQCHQLRKYHEEQHKLHEEESTNKLIASARKKSIRSKEFVKKVRRDRLIAIEAAKRRAAEMLNERKLAEAMKILQEERNKEARERARMEKEEEEQRSTSQTDVVEKVEEEERAAELEADEEDLENMLRARGKSRGGSRGGSRGARRKSGKK